jgi:hypothetical protein
MTSRTVLLWILLAVGAVWILAHAIRRDIRYDDEYPGDLRNRIVGARLIEDGRDPYFHKWKKAEGIRYYDPENFLDMKVSATTVSPFFLQLLAPIADWPEAQIVPFWLVLEYLAMAIITVIAVLIARTPAQKQMVLVIALLFLLTNAWKEHINLGQCYIFTPLIAALFYWSMRGKDSLVLAFLAGLFAVCLILYRPNAIFFFLPFVLLIRRYSRNWLIAFCIAPLLLGGWSLVSHSERGLWQKYSMMIDEQIKIHQHIPYQHVVVEADPKYPQWEGINMPLEQLLWDQESDKFYSEQGNVFVIYQHLFGRSLPVSILTAIFLAVTGGLLFFFWRSHPLRELSLERITLFGYCLYMLSDLFSPLLRHQYNTLQWIFPLLLIAAVLKPGKWPVIGLLLAGMLLNIVHIPHVKMQNTMGEYLILLVLLTLSLWPQRDPKAKEALL